MPSGIASNTKRIYDNVVSIVFGKSPNKTYTTIEKSRYNREISVKFLRGYDDGKNS